MSTDKNIHSGIFPSYRWSDLVKILGLALSYGLIVKLSLKYFSVDGIVSVIYPTIGISFAVLLLGGPKYWPGVFLGELLGNLLSGVPIGIGIGLSTVDTLEPLIGAWWLIRFTAFKPALTRMKDFGMLALVAVIVSIGSSLVGPAILWLNGLVTLPHTYISSVLAWWRGEITGIFLLTPLLVILGQAPLTWPRNWKGLEFLLFLALVFVTGRFVFLYRDSSPSYLVDFDYLPFVFVLWAAMRYGRHGVMAVVLLIVAQALFGAVRGIGAFAVDLAKAGLLNFWLYMIVLDISGLALAVMLHERREAENGLRQGEERLNSAQSIAKVGSWEFDLSTNTMTFWSREHYQIFELEEMPLDKVYDAYRSKIHPDDIPLLDRLVQQAIERGEGFKYEHRVLRDDGSLKDVVGIGEVVRDEDGVPKYLRGTVQDVTERKKVEDALRAAESRYRTLFEQSPYGILLLDLETGKALDTNAMTYRQLGYTREEFAELTISDYEVNESPEEVAQHVKKVLAEGSDDFDTLLRTKSGEIRNVHVWTQLFGSGDHPIAFTIFQDITERKQAEQTYQNILQAAIDGFWLVDTRGNLIEVNDAYCQMSGYTRAELLQMNVVDLEGMMDAAEIERRIKQIMGYGNDRFVTRHRRKDGTLVDVEVSTQFMNMRGGMFVSFLQDITERKRAEEELRENESRLRETQRIAKLGYWEWNLLTNEITWSDETKNITGYTPDMGPTTAELFMSLVHPEDRAAMTKVMESAMNRVEAPDVEYRLVRPDGKVVNVYTRVQSKKETDGKLITLTGSVQDVTELKMAEQALVNSEVKHRALIDNLSDLILIVDEEGINIWNSPSVRQFGLTPEETVGRSAFEYVHPDDRWRLKEALDFVLSHPGETFKVPALVVMVPNGDLVYFDDTFTYLPDTPGIHGIVITVHDITETKRAENALKESETRLKHAETLARLGHYAFDADGGNLVLSDMLKEISGFAMDANPTLDQLMAHIAPADMERVTKALAEAIQIKQGFDIEYRILRPDHTFVDVYSVAVTSITKESGKLRFFGTILDITERKLTEEKLRQQARTMETLYAITNKLIAERDLSRLLQSIVEHAKGLLNSKIGALFLCEPENNQLRCLVSYNTRYDYTGSTLKYGEGAAGRVVQSGKALMIEDYAAWDGHSEIYVEEITAVLSVPMKWQGEILGVISVEENEITRRFTQEELDVMTLFSNQAAIAVYNARLYEQVQHELVERKQVEKKILASLHEKEVLLKEIHHRVKNNLQVISSLLYLQSQKIQTGELRGMFLKSQNRVTSMALVHEKLYQSSDLSHIPFHEYALDLARSLFHSFGVTETQVKLLVEAGNLALDIHNAIPCGLILNEIISNSLKYAFPNGQDGTIHISLDLGADDNFMLIVRDDGIGLPVDFEARSANSLGMRLIERLVDQIEGTVERSTSSVGTSYHITFPLNSGA